MAAEPTTRDAKLIQYLNEAYGKEKELETALKAHISMTTRDTYKKRLRDHLKETQQQAKGLERRIKQLGGKAETNDLPGPDIASDAANVAMAAAKKGVSLAKGPLHALRGTGEAEKLLKNAKTELWNEYEEIGNYIAIEELAKAVGDKETEKLARDHRKQEERMAAFLTKQLPQLTKAVVTDEIPPSERRKPTRRRTTRTSSSRTSSAAKTTRSSGTRAKSSSSRSKPASSPSPSRSPTRRSSSSSRGSSSRTRAKAS